MIKHYKGNVGNDLILVHTELVRDGVTLDENMHIPGDSTYDSYIKIARSRSYALTFIEGSDRGRYAQLHVDLVNSFNRGQDIYPSSVTQAYNMIVNHVEPTRPRYNVSRAPIAKESKESDSESGDDVAFVQKGAENVTCFDCGEKGHYKNSTECKKSKRKSDAQLLITDGAGVESDSDDDTLSWCMLSVGHNLTNSAGKQKLTKVQREVVRQGSISKYWILLDSESTIDIVSDKRLLINVRKVEKGKEMRCFTNGGYHDSDMIGDLPGYGTVWYNPTSIANILSLARVSKNRRVTMDSSVENCFNVYKSDGTVQKFLKSNRGLYYYDVRWGNAATVLTNTVDKNKKLFTPRMLSRADKARRLYGMIGRPSERDYTSILASNVLKIPPLLSRMLK